MEIIQRAAGDVIVLTLKGGMVIEDGENPLRAAVEALVQQGRLRLVLDFKDVPYIDSIGLGILVSKYVTVHRRGGNIKLIHLTPRVLHVLESTHLIHVFESFDSESQALQSFEAGRSIL